MFATIVTLIACTEPPAAETGTLDVRVDHNGQDDKVESTLPVTCQSRDGALYVAWMDARNGEDAIWFNASADGGKSWFPGDVKVNVGKSPARNPAIACDDDQVYVAWEDIRDGDYAYPNIYMNASDNNGRDWLEEDFAIDGDPDGEHESHAPALAAVGSSVYAAWADNSDGAYDIHVQASNDAGSTWLDAPTRADADEAGAAYSSQPRIAADSDGNVLVVWEDSRGGKVDIYSNWSDDNAKSFHGEDARLDLGDDSGAADSFTPALSMNGGYAWVAWHDYRFGAKRDILFNVSENQGHSWKEKSGRLESDAEGIADSLNAFVASDGDKAHIVWQDDRSGGYDIFYRRVDDGGSAWGTDEIRLDTDEQGQAQSYNPVAFVSSEKVIVGWQDERNDGQAVHFNDLYYNFSIDGGKSWADEDVRINSGEPGAAYTVDLSIYYFNGAVRSVWCDGRYGSGDIVSAQRDLGDPSVWIPPEEDSGAAK